MMQSFLNVIFGSSGKISFVKQIQKDPSQIDGFSSSQLEDLASYLIEIEEDNDLKAQCQGMRKTFGIDSPFRDGINHTIILKLLGIFDS